MRSDCYPMQIDYFGEEIMGSDLKAGPIFMFCLNYRFFMRLGISNSINSRAYSSMSFSSGIYL